MSTLHHCISITSVSIIIIVVIIVIVIKRKRLNMQDWKIEHNMLLVDMRSYSLSGKKA